MVKDALLIAIVGIAGAIQGFSQNRFELQFGAHAGLPFSISMESRLPGLSGPFASHAYDRAPFSVGPSVKAVLNDRFTLGLDAVYKPVRGRGAEALQNSRERSSTEGSSWDFPLLVNYHLLRSTPRFYVGAGAVVVAIVRGTTEIRTTDVPTGVTSVRMEPLRSTQSQLPAPVINAGLEWRARGIVIRPEMRYTRWRRVESELASRHLNQLEYLIGFSFRGYER
jgi:hypothetical protein